MNGIEKLRSFKEKASKGIVTTMQELESVAVQIETELEEWRAKYDKRGAVIAQLEKENQGHFAEVEELRKEVSALVAKVDELKEKLHEASESNRKHRQNTKAEKSRVNERDKQIAELKKELVGLREQLEHCVELPKVGGEHVNLDDEVMYHSEKYRIVAMDFTETGVILTLEGDCKKRKATVSNCTLVKTPYDKKGREIKAGDWIEFIELGDVVQVEKIEQCEDGRYAIYRYGRPSDSSVWDHWTPERACKHEIVPALDTKETLLEDIAKWSDGDIHLATEVQRFINRALAIGGESNE